MTTVFIDGDTIAYTSALAGEKSPDEDKLKVVLGRVKNSLNSILDKTEASDYKLYLSDATVNTFRKALYTDYKSNRPTDKPQYLESARDYMQNVWHAAMWVGLEADDAVAIEQTRIQGTGIIAAIDKDLMQVPGRVYSWRTGLIHEVTELEGARSLYTQALMGDKTDNIPGLSHCAEETILKYGLTNHARRGCGEVSARNILKNCTSTDELYYAVHDAYLETYGTKQYRYSLTEQMNLVYLIREFNGGPVLWSPPV